MKPARTAIETEAPVDGGPMRSPAITRRSNGSWYDFAMNLWSRVRSRIRILLCACSLAAAAAGCATTSPHHQSFVEAQTAHFHVQSSLGEEQTQSLIRNLEAFRVGALQVLHAGEVKGVDGPDRMRVIAFDDRTLGRPFAIRGAGAYYLPDHEGGTLVIRAGGGWNRRVDRDLLHELAHRWIRERSEERLPLWVEEGFAQAMGAARVTESGVEIGRPIPEFVTLLEDWKRTSLESVMRTTDLTGESAAGRERFSAFSWSLVQTFRFGPRSMGSTTPPFGLGSFENPRGWPNPANSSLFDGPPEALAEHVYAYFEQKRIRIDRIDVRTDGRGVQLASVAPAKSRAALGWLALAIDKPRLARQEFESSLAAEPDRAESLVGLAHATLDPFDKARTLLIRADRAAANDADVQARIGDVYRAAGEASVGDAEGQERLARARQHYERSLALDSDAVRARVGLGLLHLAPGAEAKDGVPWLEAAARLRPGSPEIELGLARLDLLRGRRHAARRRAAQVISRAHHKATLDAARSVLDQASLETGTR